MSTIYLRRAKLTDLDAIMKIIEEAREMLKENGNPQWQDGHPDRNAITQDISQEISWALMVNNQIAGFAALQLSPEPSYKTIYNGQWSHPDAPYATIHRVAISSHYRGQGLAKFLFSNLITVGQLQGQTNFRLDTHKKNKPMQSLAKKFGFVRCGEVKVDDKNDPNRIAFELNLQHGYKVNRITNDFMKGLLK
ncbi:MAG: GNAT family N-acetyltransferase [Limosilactobacillus sp.]|uniref:GNAT family N-acetyltransferase n=1 Tax=Limosilactobacillus sp. TaxID=2773925 RepID=UPI0025C49656|nr:GNAT family N-acetyltransferase [Limosilactobacillus sp.]MCI1974742.1 GNAT family N-acetyltransferase [Limosilactobacillus sp.]MCI2030522.1 GNAT family N-acetyltransferase [Limosilactobacillus sp.]